MNHQPLRSILILLVAFSTCYAAAKSNSGKPGGLKGKPNVLMICIDDLNDWVGFLGGHPQTKTPHMDDLAAKGVNFTKAYCTAPGCSPSRNALLLGAEPHNSGLYPFYELQKIEEGVLDTYTALPEHFRKNGYITSGANKVFHENKYRLDENWDSYTFYNSNKMKPLKELGYVPSKEDYPMPKRLMGYPADNPPEDFLDHKGTMHGVRFLEQKHEKPFFLSVGYYKPHSPFIMPLKNFERFDFPITPPAIKDDDLSDVPIAGRSNAQIIPDFIYRKDNAWETIMRCYLACVNFIDDNVGLLMDALENSPYADNTIVVLWSDHGYHLGEKRTFSKFSLWEEATRTPFIIWDPRRKGNGYNCDEAVGLINVYRTLCDLTGIEAPDYVDGTSLRPWLDNPKLPKEQPALVTWGRGNYSLRTEQWRYIRYFDGSEELYNSTEDPNEWTNLAGNPEYRPLMDKLAGKWLPKTEAPQVTSGITVYNVADADSPTKQINKHKNLANKVQPPLD